MNWHETIVQIRTKPEYQELVKEAYLSEDLVSNIERFEESDEFKETLSLLSQYAPGAKTILDVGAGNGISAINFSKKGYSVTVVEPDPSDSVGAGAIQSLKKHYSLDSLQIYQQFAEEIGFAENSFDIVYVRQAMHHAYDLKKFIKECARVLKEGGVLVTIRDHVVFDPADKTKFLESHPLHRFYGGENAFSPEEYKEAMTEAGLEIKKELRFLDSIINYSPLKESDITNYPQNQLASLRKSLQSKIGIFAAIPPFFWLYKMKNKSTLQLNELNFPGRIYSYIAQKNNSSK